MTELFLRKSVEIIQIAMQYGWNIDLCDDYIILHFPGDTEGQKKNKP